LKETTSLRRVEKRLRPGVVSLHGFIGDDKRRLHEILDADNATVERLGLTHRSIADRLNHFTRLAMSGYGTPKRQGDFEAVVTETRGWLGCPFGDQGVFRKGEIALTNLTTGRTLLWTPLLVHLIGVHGFYEGKGSRYRIDPEDARTVLEL